MIFYIALFDTTWNHSLLFLGHGNKETAHIQYFKYTQLQWGWMMQPLVYVSTCINNLTYTRLERIKTLINWFPRNDVVIIFLAVRFANKTNLFWWNAVRLKVNNIMELAYKVCFKCIISHFILFKIKKYLIIQNNNLFGHLSSILFDHRSWEN